MNPQIAGGVEVQCKSTLSLSVSHLGDLFAGETDVCGSRLATLILFFSLFYRVFSVWKKNGLAHEEARLMIVALAYQPRICLHRLLRRATVYISYLCPVPGYFDNRPYKKNWWRKVGSAALSRVR